jgi:hypothetical protein
MAAIRQARDKKTARFNDVQFVRYELSKEQVADLKIRFADGQLDLDDTLNNAVEQGYRITLKYDTYSKSPACFLQQVDDDGDNAGMILSGRGRTARSAIIEAMYKHFIVFDGQWPSGDLKNHFPVWDDK